jgi:hypothetical protein
LLDKSYTLTTCSSAAVDAVSFAGGLCAGHGLRHSHPADVHVMFFYKPFSPTTCFSASFPLPMLRHLQVGYVQGMGFVTAILLMYIS